MKKVKSIIIGFIAVVFLVILAVTVMVIVGAVNGKKYHQLQILTEKQAYTINVYIDDLEKKLSKYGKSSQIINLLKETDNQEYRQTAQEFTEDFSENAPTFESIYASDCSSQVLVHTNPMNTGLNDDTALPDNAKINVSAHFDSDENEMILSVYKAEYDDNGQPIGMVGINIRTDELADLIEKTEFADLKTSFSLIDVSDYKYIIASDNSLLNKTMDNKDIVSVCDECRESQNERVRKVQVTRNGKKSILSYKYISKYDWLLITDLS